MAQVISIRLADVEAERLRARATADGSTMADVLRELIRTGERETQIQAMRQALEARLERVEKAIRALEVVD